MFYTVRMDKAIAHEAVLREDKLSECIIYHPVQLYWRTNSLAIPQRQNDKYKVLRAGQRTRTGSSSSSLEFYPFCDRHLNKYPCHVLQF